MHGDAKQEQRGQGKHHPPGLPDRQLRIAIDNGANEDRVLAESERVERIERDTRVQHRRGDGGVAQWRRPALVLPPERQHDRSRAKHHEPNRCIQGLQPHEQDGAHAHDGRRAEACILKPRGCALLTRAEQAGRRQRERVLIDVVEDDRRNERGENPAQDAAE